MTYVKENIENKIIKIKRNLIINIKYKNKEKYERNVLI